MRISVLVALLSLAGLAGASTVTMTFVGPATNIAANGSYVSPYDFLVNGQHVQLVCDDPNHEILPGDQWQAKEFTLADDLKHTRWDNAGLYMEIFWLTGDLLKGNPNMYAADQLAIWHLVDPTVPLTSAAQDRINLVGSLDLKDIDFSRYVIFSPTDQSRNGPQEQIGLLTTPEPGTGLLAGLALCGVGFLRRKKRC